MNIVRVRQKLILWFAERTSDYLFKDSLKFSYLLFDFIIRTIMLDISKVMSTFISSSLSMREKKIMKKLRSVKIDLEDFCKRYNYRNEGRILF